MPCCLGHRVLIPTNVILNVSMALFLDEISFLNQWILSVANCSQGEPYGVGGGLNRTKGLVTLKQEEFSSGSPWTLSAPQLCCFSLQGTLAWSSPTAWAGLIRLHDHIRRPGLRMNPLCLDHVYTSLCLYPWVLLVLLLWNPDRYTQFPVEIVTWNMGAP